MYQDQSYLLDIAKLCRTIIRLTANMTEAQFQQDERTQLAILYEITILGEVVKRLSIEFRNQHSTIEWKKISGMRDRLVHKYNEIQATSYPVFSGRGTVFAPKAAFDQSNPHQMFNVKLRSVPWRIESMFAVPMQSPKLTPEEYFAWEEQQLDRHEYINGEVYAMSGGTQNHSRISLKFGALLDSHLSNGNCRVFNADCRVKIVETNDYTYPDVSVSCDRRDQTTEQYITYPCLIVEVLSDSTEAYDRGKKFFRYRQNPQLQDYVLVSSKEIAIDLYCKTENERWEIINYRAGEIVELQSVNLSFPIEQVYRGIDFSEVSVEPTTPEP